VAGAEPLSELETLRFENEKLRRRIEELLSQREQDRQTRLTLEFQILKLTADLKALAAGVAAGQSEPAPAAAPPREAGSDGQPAFPGGERDQTT
jgi:chromosome segregation ATPase